MKVEMLSPTGALFSKEAKCVVAPGSEGEVGILNNHAPILIALKKGDVHITVETGLEHWHVDDGFLQVKNNEVLILVEKGVKAV